MLELRFRRAWLALVWLLVAAILYGSLTPGPFPGAISIHDKLGHFASYFLLTLAGVGIVRPEAYGAVAWRALLLGAALELGQYLLTSARHADFGDLLANAAGVFAAWWLAVAGAGGWAARAEAWVGRRGGDRRNR